MSAPFVLELPSRYPHQQAFLSSLGVGAAVILLGVVHGLQWESGRRASRIALCLGLLLTASPIFFGYSYSDRPGRAATLNAVISGGAIVAGSLLSLAGSGAPAQPPDPEPLAPATPALWPAPGRTPPDRPFNGRADARAVSVTGNKVPLAWGAVGSLIAGAVALGLAVVLHGWLLAAVGACLGAFGTAVAVRVRILADVSLGQRPGGP